MSARQTKASPSRRKPGSPFQGVRLYLDETSRPIYSLWFLLPWLAFCEVGAILWVEPGQSIETANRVVAFQMLEWFFGLFGSTWVILPGLTVVAILLAWQWASGRPWRIRPGWLPVMLGESVILALPLMSINHVLKLQGAWRPGAANAVLSIGAGVYEELVFRMILIALLAMIILDLLHASKTLGTIAVVFISAVLFAAHHHAPLGSEPFAMIPFLFRTFAGVYLAYVYLQRGYGLAAGTHAIYNLMVIVTAR